MRQNRDSKLTRWCAISLPSPPRKLLQSLREHRGNATAVAREMGKARVQVQRWMRRFAIDPEFFQA